MAVHGAGRQMVAGPGPPSLTGDEEEESPEVSHTLLTLHTHIYTVTLQLTCSL